MKLLEKNNRIFIRFMALLLLFGSVLFYISVNWIARSEIDEKLEVNQLRIISLLSAGQPAPQFAPIVEVEILSKKTTAIEDFSDMLIFDPMEGEEEPFRQLVSEVEINGNFYRITNRAPLLEAEDLMLAIGCCAAALTLLFFAGWFNHRSARAIWLPFRQNLDTLKKFSLAQNEQPTLVSSDVDEFEELKTALQQLIDKGRSDYRNLKEFTENASHEIQTPLAIIQAKLEDALQSPNLTEEHAQHLETANNAVLRLSRLNRCLLLLAKIDNHQFSSEEQVSISNQLKQQSIQLEDFIKEKKLTLNMDLQADPIVKVHPILVETLLSNLLVNAIGHNVEGGDVGVVLNKKSLTISNTGMPLDVPSGQLFERFKKGDASPGSLGLGLAIVKSICDNYQWKITYQLNGERHLFSLFF